MMKSTGLISLVLMVHFSLGVVPPGSRGTIDFRYPDVIVKPRPECKEEGVFPHPRNCTWYYRCVDTLGLGFYRQFYFECEPGTVFFDPLDQCIFPTGSSDECGGETSTTSGSSITDVTDTTTLIPITFPTDNPKTTPATQVTEVTTTASSFEDCYVTMIQCRDYKCPDMNGDLLNSGSICPQAYRECDGNPEKVDLCLAPMYFSLSAGKCVPPPENTGCIEIVDGPPPPTTTPPTTTTPAPPPPPQNCFDTMEGCKDYTCPTEGGLTTKENVCQKAFQVCNDKSVTFYCRDTHHYDPETRKCVTPPEQRGCTAQSSIGSVNINIFVECSFDNPRPHSAKFNEYFCKNYKLCQLRGLRNNKVELCSSYLQCARANDEWIVNTESCKPGFLFSHASDNCVEEPVQNC